MNRISEMYRAMLTPWMCFNCRGSGGNQKIMSKFRCVGCTCTRFVSTELSNKDRGEVLFCWLRMV